MSHPYQDSQVFDYAHGDLETFAKLVFQGSKCSSNFDKRVGKLRIAKRAFESEIERCFQESVHVQKVVAVDTNVRIRQQTVVSEDSNARLRQLEESHRQLEQKHLW